jgi:SAM domain (Sterile alpha motif)/Memo-like protein
MDLGGWLRSLGLERYEAAFRENEIDDTVLPNLTAEDLKDLGVGIVGHRRKLLDAIAVLRPLRHSQRVGAFETPLGRVPIDVEALRKIADLPFVIRADAPHAPEHALEVELPFLGSFQLVPLVVGDAAAKDVAHVLRQRGKHSAPSPEGDRPQDRGTRAAPHHGGYTP